MNSVDMGLSRCSQSKGTGHKRRLYLFNNGEEDGTSLEVRC